MRAILIDATARTITEIDHSGKLADMYATLGVELVECVSLARTADLWIDEEGAINGTAFGFIIQGRPIIGNGLLLSVNAQGDCVDLSPDWTLARVDRAVTAWAAKTRDV